MKEVYAGIDLGGTNIKGAIAGADGKVLAEQSVPTESHKGPRGVMANMARLVKKLSRSARRQPAAVGICVPGLADLKSGLTRFLPNLPTKWRNVPVRNTLEPLVGCPVYLLNDARAAALGELTFGHGRDANTMIFFTLGTGIGGGVVVDRRLRLGPLGAAGELGHQCILPNGPRCGCGARGCMETLASAPAIVGEGVRLLLSGQAPRLHRIVGGDPGKVTPKEMAQAAKAGDACIAEAITRAAEYLGIGVANMVTALHPDLVVLGGGAAAIGDLIFKTVRRTVRERVHMFPTDDIRILPSLLGNHAGFLGGVALAMKQGKVE
jgi:glucokinase